MSFIHPQGFALLKNIKRRLVHFIYYWKWVFGYRKTAQDFYAESIVSIAARWEGEVDPLLTYTAMYDVLRQRGFSGSFWELGGGYSTILAPLSLRLPATSVHSVDFNPVKYHRILNSPAIAHAFLKNINLYSEITVSYAQVNEALREVSQRLCIYPLEAVKQTLSIYAGDTFESCSDMEKLTSKLVSTFNEHPHAIEEYGFYQQFDAIEGEKLSSRLAKRGKQMDALFLDCGELSSIAEFVLLESLVPIDGYILLHDIYYPKSIKNYLVAAIIDLSPDWEVLYRDSASRQGGLVAVRKNV